MDSCRYQKRRGGKFDRFSVQIYPDYDMGSGEEEEENNSWDFGFGSNQFQGMDTTSDYFDYSQFLNDPSMYTDSLYNKDEFEEYFEEPEEISNDDHFLNDISLGNEQKQFLGEPDEHLENQAFKRTRGQKKQARFYLKERCELFGELNRMIQAKATHSKE